MFRKFPILIGILVLALRSLTAAPEPSLAFREDWKIGNEKLGNPGLALTVYGPGSSNIDVVHSGGPGGENYLDMGACRARCAFTLRDRTRYFDFTNPDSRIHWRTMQDGFYEFKIVVRLADGSWLISDHNQGGLPDWTEDSYTINEYHWYQTDIDTLHSGPEVLKPDFRKVDAIGCACSSADDMNCAASPGILRLDWLEVYGALQPRP